MRNHVAPCYFHRHHESRKMVSRDHHRRNSTRTLVFNLKAEALGSLINNLPLDGAVINIANFSWFFGDISSRVDCYPDKN